MYSSSTHDEVAEELCAQLGCGIHLVDATYSHSQCFDGAISLAWVGLMERFSEFTIAPGCMGATIEYRGMTDVTDEYAESDSANLMQFLINQNIVIGTQMEIPPVQCKATPIEAQIYIESKHTGLVIYKKRCGEHVEKGESWVNSNKGTQCVIRNCLTRYKVRNITNFGLPNFHAIAGVNLGGGIPAVSWSFSSEKSYSPGRFICNHEMTEPLVKASSNDAR